MLANPNELVAIMIDAMDKWYKENKYLTVEVNGQTVMMGNVHGK